MSQTNTNPNQSKGVAFPERMEMDHYTNEQGFMVFTERFHIKRGVCCGNGCLHCPFLPRHEKGGRLLNDVVQDQLKNVP